jgi:hypothetical protein
LRVAFCGVLEKARQSRFFLAAGAHPFALAMCSASLRRLY